MRMEKFTTRRGYNIWINLDLVLAVHAYDESRPHKGTYLGRDAIGDAGDILVTATIDEVLEKMERR